MLILHKLLWHNLGTWSGDSLYIFLVNFFQNLDWLTVSKWVFFWKLVKYWMFCLFLSFDFIFLLFYQKWPFFFINRMKEALLPDLTKIFSIQYENMIKIKVSYDILLLTLLSNHIKPRKWIITLSASFIDISTLIQGIS